MKVREEGFISGRLSQTMTPVMNLQPFCLNLGKAQPIMRGTFFPGSRGRASVYSRLHSLASITTLESITKLNTKFIEILYSSLLFYCIFKSLLCIISSLPVANANTILPSRGTQPTRITSPELPRPPSKKNLTYCNSTPMPTVARSERNSHRRASDLPSPPPWTPVFTECRRRVSTPINGI